MGQFGQVTVLYYHLPSLIIAKAARGWEPDLMTRYGCSRRSTSRGSMWKQHGTGFERAQLAGCAMSLTTWRSDLACFASASIPTRPRHLAGLDRIDASCASFHVALCPLSLREMMRPLPTREISERSNASVVVVRLAVPYWSRPS